LIEDLIFDVGMHRGEDAAFYLQKGFRVVAIEADPAHCAVAAERLRRFVESGQLTIVNTAISTRKEKVEFYRNLDVPEWGTMDDALLARNSRHGTRVERIVVEALPMAEIFASFGVPYYMKVDIEGRDMLCVDALRRAPTRPRYLSIEAHRFSLDAVKAEFDLMTALGYHGFKVVPQHRVHQQVAPHPSREGAYVDHRFVNGTSGLFGEEAPGRWRDAAAAFEQYKPIFRRYRLVGDDPLIKIRRLRRILRRLGIEAGWYDTHARL
jgi:FkbM family methyltransferase